MPINPIVPLDQTTSAFLNEEQALAQRRRDMRETSQARSMLTEKSLPPSVQGAARAGRTIGDFFRQRYAKLSPEEKLMAEAVEAATKKTTNAKHPQWGAYGDWSPQMRAFEFKSNLAEELARRGDIQRSLQVGMEASNEKQAWETAEAEKLKLLAETKKSAAKPIDKELKVGVPQTFYPVASVDPNDGVMGARREDGNIDMFLPKGGVEIVPPGAYTTDRPSRPGQPPETTTPLHEMNTAELAGEFKKYYGTAQATVVQNLFNSGEIMMTEGLAMSDLLDLEKKTFGEQGLNPESFILGPQGRVLNFFAGMDNAISALVKVATSIKEDPLDAEWAAKGVTNEKDLLITGAGVGGENVVMHGAGNVSGYNNAKQDAELLHEIELINRGENPYGDWLADYGVDKTLREKLQTNKQLRSQFFAKVISANYAAMRAREPAARQFSDLDFKESMKTIGGDATSAAQFRAIYLSTTLANIRKLRNTLDMLPLSTIGTNPFRDKLLFPEAFKNRYLDTERKFIQAFAPYGIHDLAEGTLGDQYRVKRDAGELGDYEFRGLEGYPYTGTRDYGQAIGGAPVTSDAVRAGSLSDEESRAAASSQREENQLTGR